MIKDIGTLTGRVLVFGGVYSNYEALEAIQAVAKAKNIAPENIICTGDIVAYCSNPAKCVETVEAWGIHCIAGNVELNLIDRVEDCGCNFVDGSRCDVFSKQWYPFAQSELTEGHLNYLKTIPKHLTFNYQNKQVFVLHGTIDETSGYIFKSTQWEVKATILKQANADVILAGHCGIPFQDERDDQWWINAGVIGMPANDGQSSTWYCVLDDSKPFAPEFHKLTYDHKSAAQRMIATNLIPAYAKTLLTGIWDNCDVLPVHETSWQGKELELDL